MSHDAQEHDENRNNKEYGYRCPYCNQRMVNTGYDDGGGDYGSSICEQWECYDCEHSEEHGCIDDYGR